MNDREKIAWLWVALAGLGVVVYVLAIVIAVPGNEFIRLIDSGGTPAGFIMVATIFGPYLFALLLRATYLAGKRKR